MHNLPSLGANHDFHVIRVRSGKETSVHSGQKGFGSDFFTIHHSKIKNGVVERVPKYITTNNTKKKEYKYPIKS